MAAIAATNASVNTSYTRRSTRNLLGEVHTCPALTILARTAVFAALTGSVSAQTMTGACPPSSMWAGFMALAARPARCLPTGTDPVNAMNLMAGSGITLREISSGTPNSTFSTPAGSPASSKARAISETVAGTSSEGLITMEQPAASAAEIFRIGPPAGKFHGTNAPTGPTGVTRTDKISSGPEGMIRP